MKKLDESVLRNYPPVVLKVEDIEELDRVLRENSKRVTIRCDDYSFESVAELEEHFKGTRVRNIQLTAIDPDAIIELRSFESRIFIILSNTQASGMLFQIDQILSRCKRLGSWAYNSYILILGALVTLLALKVGPDHIYRTSAIAFFAGMMIIWSAWSAFVGIFRHSTMYIVRRRHEQTFIKRNRDQLTVALFAATLGALLGATATYVVNSITKAQPNIPVETDAPKVGRPSP